jgi:predicted DNA-binding transcriptional regulator AlpA
MPAVSAFCSGMARGLSATAGDPRSGSHFMSISLYRKQALQPIVPLAIGANATNRARGRRCAVSELKREIIGDAPEQGGTNGTTPNLIVLRLPAVCRMTGLRRSTIYRMQASGQFPQRVKIGARSVG